MVRSADMILAGMRSDAELVCRALAEEPWASEALVLRYQKKACAIAGAAGVPQDRDPGHPSGV
jgi:hypothetical protein